MSDGFFPTLVSANQNANSLTNQMFVQLTDGTEGAQIDASGNLNVILAANSGVDIGDVDVLSVIPGTGASNLGKAEDAVHSSGDVGVQLLAVRNDTLATLVDTDGDYAPLQVDADGALYVTGDLTINFTYDYAEDSAHTDTDVGAFVLAVRQDTLGASVDTDGDYAAFKVNSVGALYVTLASHAITNANALPVSANNTANSEANPLFVYQVNTVVSGSEFQDYDTTVDVAGGGTDNHDYTVVNTTGLLKSIIFSASGGGKVEVQAGPLASLVTKAVAFVPKHGGTVQLFFDPPIEATGTTPTFRLIRTNRESSVQDVYSTMIGSDV